MLYMKVLEVSTHSLHGKFIEPKRLKQRPVLNTLQKIFVGGVDPQMAESSIREYFSQFGEVSLSTVLAYDDETKYKLTSDFFCLYCSVS